MTKITVRDRIKGIFAYCLEMDNRGVKNIIHCIGSNIYIVNFDYSMILRFSLRRIRTNFDSPISFNANKYKSLNFGFTEDEDGNNTVFISHSEPHKRKKNHGSSDSKLDIEAIKKQYRRLIEKAKNNDYTFFLSDGIIPLLEKDLSHTEISVENSKLIIRQRNIYTGDLIEITRKDSVFLTVNKLPANRPPYALKTEDFMRLFAISKSLEFIPTENFLVVKDAVRDDFDGVLSFCTYDGLNDYYLKKD